MSRLLIEQIGSELRAHQFYLAVSIWFDRQSLKGWAKLWSKQSVEEAGHASRIMDFLVDNEVDFNLPALKSVSTRFSSAAAAVEQALQNEHDVTKQFNKMAAAATEETDHRAFQFLQWFIEEQVEEERKAQGLLDLINSGINLYQAEPLLDQFE